MNASAAGAASRSLSSPRARARPGRRSNRWIGALGSSLARWSWLSEEIERCIHTETRTVVLGHVQRGGTPTAHDRVLATRFGVGAADLALAGEWGRMVALHGNEITSVPLPDAVRKVKELDPAIWEIAKVFSG